MKIRTGFVANSSSSSFIIAGECFEYDLSEIENLYKKYNVDFRTFDDTEVFEDLDDFIETDYYEAINELAKALNMDYVIDSEDGYFYFGYDLNQNSINKVIEKANKAKEVYGPDVEIHSGTIYN